MWCNGSAAAPCSSCQMSVLVSLFTSSLHLLVDALESPPSSLMHTHTRVAPSKLFVYTSLLLLFICESSCQALTTHLQGLATSAKTDKATKTKAKEMMAGAVKQRIAKGKRDKTRAQVQAKVGQVNKRSGE